MRLIYATLALLFILFAYVQLNDPDPWLWIIWYVYMAGMAALTVFQQYYRWLLLGGIVVSVVGIAYLFPSVIDWFSNRSFSDVTESMSPDKIFIEEVRECFGLVISFLTLLPLYYRNRPFNQ